MKKENELDVLDLMQVKGGAGKGIICIFSSAVRCDSGAVPPQGQK